MAHVGNWFAAQQKFKADNLACSGGLSIAIWCAASRDKCCAVCPNAPMTGPGTAIVFTIGTFVNLLFVLIYKSEAPYNLAFQLLATDGALFGLFDRLLEPKNRLTEFHYSFTPMLIMSAVPIAVAASLVDLQSLHAMSAQAYETLLAQRYRENALRAPRHLEDARRSESDEAPRGRHSPFDLVFWVFIGHIMAWIAVFLYNYAANDDFFQSNCSDTFPLRSYRIAIGAVVASWCCIALLFWSALGLGLSAKKRGRTYKLDVIEVIASVLHWRKLQIWAQPRPNGGKFRIFRKTVTSREAIRWSIAIGMYVIWVAEFLGFYFSSLQSFVMMGDNPFDYGQVAACIGIVVPVVIVGRSVLDIQDGWASKRNAWKDVASANALEDTKNALRRRVSMLKKQSLRVDERPISPPRDGRNSNSRRDSPTRYDSILPGTLSPNEPGERHRSSSSTPHRPSLGNDDEGYMMTGALAPQNTTSRDRVDDVQEEGGPSRGRRRLSSSDSRKSTGSRRVRTRRGDADVV